MPIVKQLKAVVGQLPPKEALKLRLWIQEFEAARRYKKLKVCQQAHDLLQKFEETGNQSSLN